MKFFDDFNLGDETVTRGRTITEADIVIFAGFTGDWHQLHTDVEYAKKGPFGERIAHGFLVLCAGSGLMPLNEMAIMAFYGMDRVRFVAPTKIGDTIHVEMKVSDKKESNEKSGVVTFETIIKNQKGEDLVVYSISALLKKK